MAWRTIEAQRAYDDGYKQALLDAIAEREGRQSSQERRRRINPLRLGKFGDDPNMGNGLILKSPF